MKDKKPDLKTAKKTDLKTAKKPDLKNAKKVDLKADAKKKKTVKESTTSGAIAPVASPLGMKRRVPVKEARRNTMLALFESELEKADIVLAVKGMVDEVQGMAEKLSKMQAEDLMPINDRIKAEMSAEQAEQFSNNVTEALQEAFAAVRKVRDVIDNEALILSGDASRDPGTQDMENGAMGSPDALTDMDSGGPEMAGGGEEDLADGGAGDIADILGGGGEDLGREMKESISSPHIKILLKEAHRSYRKGNLKEAKRLFGLAKVMESSLKKRVKA